MKKLPLFLMFLGIAFLVFAILISTNVYHEILAMNGFNELNKVSVTVKNKTPNLMFTSSDIDKLQEKLSTDQLGYYASTNATMKKENQYFNTRISGVNPYYRSFIDLNMIHGCFFTYKGLECKYVAVIDANLAWDMFHSADVVGQEIELYDIKFEVVGVYEKYNSLDDNSNENIVEKLTDDGLYNIYIPVNTLMEVDPGILIDTVFIKTQPEIIIGENKDKISNALQSIGKWAPNYEIIDFNKSKVLLEQKPKIIVFILALIMVCIIVLFAKNEAAKIYRVIKEGLRNDYITGLVIKNRRLLIVQVIKVIISIALAIFIISNVKFNLYISPEYLNDELIDTKYYADLVESKINEFNQNLNIAKSQSQLEYSVADKLTNYQLLIAVLIGIPLLNIGIYQLLRDDLQIFHAVCYCAGFFGASLLLAVLLLSKLGLPYMLDLKNVGIIWMNALASIIYSYYRKENIHYKAELLRF